MHDDEMALLLEVLAELAAPFGGHIPPPAPATVRGVVNPGDPMPAPTLGRIVHYRGKIGRHGMRAAIVTGTVDSVTPDGIESGDVPAFDSPNHVHLWVFTPGQSAGFAEFNVPLGEPSEHQVGQIPPGTWSWPPRV